MRALDLFCCGGGAGMGLHQAGFTVVGVDISPQPKYPFEFHQADATTFSLVGYDFLWASPPCQKHTKAKKLQGNTHPCFIDVIRDRFKKSGLPYCIENVPGSPLENPVVLCGTMFNLKTYRHRLFEANFPIVPPPSPPAYLEADKDGAPTEGGGIYTSSWPFFRCAIRKRSNGDRLAWAKRTARSYTPSLFKIYSPTVP